MNGEQEKIKKIQAVLEFNELKKKYLNFFSNAAKELFSNL
jgi:hypothetical protein